MSFRGCRAGLPVALTLVLLACGGRSFEIVGTDGGSPGDGGGGDEGGGDASGPDDGGGSPDVGADQGTPPACPIPATITESAPCATNGLDCPSAAPIYTCGGGQVTGYATCACSSGHWACPAATCVEAGAPPPSCPPPRLVHEAVACTSAGEECPGNPTPCGAMTFNDVFMCTKALVWTRIVATVCADGG